MKTTKLYIYKELFKKCCDKLGRSYAKLSEAYFPAEYYKKNVINNLQKLRSSCNDTKMSLSAIPNIVLESTNRCNLNCSMCRTLEAKRPKTEMSIKFFEEMVKLKRSLGQNGLVIHTVGEPFMYSNMEDALKICSENGMHIWITTNGLLIDRWLPTMRKYPSVIKHIAFSIDGATKKTYEAIRQGGNFDKLIENIKLVTEYRRTIMNKVSISMQVSLSKSNFEEIPEFYKVFCSYFKLSDILFIFMSNLSARHEDNMYYKSSRLNLQPLYGRSSPCRLLWRQLHILNDGRVSACCRDYDGELIVGDVKKASIDKIWHGSLYENLRKKHMLGDVDDTPLCKDCYAVYPYVSVAFNNFLRYLFTMYKEKRDEFYLNSISNFLKNMVYIKKINANKMDIKELFRETA